MWSPHLDLNRSSAPGPACPECPGKPTVHAAVRVRTPTSCFRCCGYLLLSNQETVKNIEDRPEDHSLLFFLSQPGGSCPPQSSLEHRRVPGATHSLSHSRSPQTQDGLVKGDKLSTQRHVLAALMYSCTLHGRGLTHHQNRNPEPRPRVPRSFLLVIVQSDL